MQIVYPQPIKEIGKTYPVSDSTIVEGSQGPLFYVRITGRTTSSNAEQDRIQDRAWAA